MNNLFFLLFYITFYLGSSFASSIEFEADKTSLDTKKELLLLEGNVSLKVENIVFKADRVSLDNKNEIFSSEKINFSTLDNYLYGQTNFVIISANETKMKNVEFSSCPCKDKIWWIESQELAFENNNKILSAKKSKLIVQGKTLAYLNSASFPISAKRKSGILLPEISINERSGLDVKIPIYLNLKENLDLTIEPRVMTQRGFGLTNQLRYLGKRYEGYFNSSFLSDSKSSFKILETDDLRWSYNLVHKQKIGDSIFFNLNTSSTGDPFYLSDLGSFMSGLSRTFILPQKSEVTYFKNNFSIKTDINSFKLTNPLGFNQFQRIPGIEVKYFYNKKNFNFQIDTDFAYFRKGGSFRNSEKQNLKRLILKPKLSYAFFKKNYYLQTSFMVDYSMVDVKDEESSELLPSLRVNQSLKFFKKSLSSRMLVEPFFDFLISDKKKIVNGPVIDSGLRMSSFNKNSKFGDLFFSFQRDLNLGAKINLKNRNDFDLTFKVEKLYTFGTKSLFYENIRLDLPDPFSLRLRYISKKNINFYSNISFDDDSNFTSYKNTLKIKSDKFNISINHNLVKNLNSFNLSKNIEEKRKINSLDIMSTIKFNNNWSGGFKFINDLEQKKNVNSVISLDYENDGLILGLAYMKSLELDWISILENSTFKDYHKDRFRLFFELKGLGSLGRPKEDYIKRRNL